MTCVYQSNNGWAINKQHDLLGKDVYCVYRYYPLEKQWSPFRMGGSDIKTCLQWLLDCNAITYDEMVFQLSVLGEKQ